MQRLPDDLSIFTADAKAVDLALDFIRTYDTNNKISVQRIHRFRNVKKNVTSF